MRYSDSFNFRVSEVMLLLEGSFIRRGGAHLGGGGGFSGAEVLCCGKVLG